MSYEQDMMDRLQKSGDYANLGEKDVNYAAPEDEMFKLAQPMPSQSEAAKLAQAAQSSSPAEGAAQGTAAGAATGNPWVAGGMAAMGALSAGLERKRKEREAEYLSRVERLKAQQQAIGQAGQFASRISY
jgi:hypothetical protein